MHHLLEIAFSSNGEMDFFSFSRLLESSSPYEFQFCLILKEGKRETKLKEITD